MRAVLVIACLFLFGCGKADEPRPNFEAMASVAGMSMLPTFGTLEIVALELCSFDDVGAGDTVIFWHEGAKLYVHHRLVSRDATGLWLTQGDNNPTVDRGHMSRTQFVGRTHKL